MTFLTTVEINRKIDLFKVDAVTLSKDPKSAEFIIHVVDEYDYRYLSTQYCELIAQSIRKITKLKGHSVKFFRVVSSSLYVTLSHSLASK